MQPHYACGVTVPIFPTVCYRLQLDGEALAAAKQLMAYDPLSLFIMPISAIDVAIALLELALVNSFVSALGCRRLSTAPC